jgi:phosphoglucomutase
MSALCDAMDIRDMTTVTEQQEPDPDFPTVAFPNPEESGALDLAMKTADNLSRDIIIANDPDADRFAAAEKVKCVYIQPSLQRVSNKLKSGSWFKFTGDQIGILLASFLLDAFKGKRERTKPLAMLCTAVSTSMLSKMAEIEGFYFEETLTGFKWLGNVARILEDKGYEVPLAFEEALGYMFTEVCYDKDGLTAAMAFLAAEAKWRSEGLSPYMKLQELYKTYGYHENLNTYFVSPDLETTVRLFNSIRNRPQNKRDIVGSVPIFRWRDMTEAFDSATPNNVPVLPVDPSIQMLTVWSTRGVRFTLRASGTEPKVKSKCSGERSLTVSLTLVCTTLVYIESCCNSREDAVSAVWNVFLGVLEDWIHRYAPSMTYSRTLFSSSGHVFELD